MENTKKKRTLIGIAAGAAVLIIAASALAFWPRTPKAEITLFVGDTCPHCHNVENYIAANNIDKRLKFTELEVFNNQDNSRQLASRAAACGLDTSAGIGVPFLYDGTSCYEGEDQVVGFFQKRLGTGPETVASSSETLPLEN